LVERIAAPPHRRITVNFVVKKAAADSKGGPIKLKIVAKTRNGIVWSSTAPK
jgi:hypothetical protein